VSDDEDYLEGFAVMPREIQRDRTLSWKAKLVYLALSSRANRRMQCWPSIPTIADECCFSEDTVKRGLRELRDRDLVSWSLDKSKGAPGRHPNRYTLNGLTQAEAGSDDGDDKGQPAPPRGAHSTPTPRSQHPHGVLTAPLTIQVNDASEERTSHPEGGAARRQRKGSRRRAGGAPATPEQFSESSLQTL